MQIKSLKEICSLITKGTTPTSLGMKLNEGNINFIKVECLSEDGNIISSKMQKIDETTHNKLNRSKLQEGDILYSIAGSIGRMTVVDSSILPANTNQAVAILRPIKELIDTRYLFYFLKDTKSQKNAKRRIVQSVQTNLSLGELSGLEVAIPSLPMQIAIGNFMNNLDAKIAANNTLSKTLEDIAQTIFKSWFIDFDPVKAKMAGEKPAGMDAATAALFPDTMVESELGSIPKGWSISKVNSLTKTLVGGTPSRIREDFWNGHIPWFNSGKVNEFRIIEASEYITELGLQKSAAKLLPVGTTVLAITGATLGQYSRVEISASGTQNVIGILESDSISNEFIYSFIASGISRIVAAGTGGAQQHINKDIVDNFEFIFPGKNLVDAFTLIVGSMFQQISALTFSSKNLSQLRDALLPRLISGELQIPEEMLAS
jgi:type I restriction enzyme S subunit